jgi:ribose transport system ATP-binding protein
VPIRPASTAHPLVELDSVSKWFGATRALDHVSLQLHPGQVHVVAGENGAGKTTLIRILSGAYTDYPGTVRIGGQRVTFRGPPDATRAGIATIHQELSLVGALSVTDNLLLGSPGSPFALLGRRRLREAARRVLDLVELRVDPDQAVETLPLAEQQLVEIGRALAQRARVLIMDEPTSALSEPEANLLFARIARLRSQGAGIIYISHRLEEIYRLADRITVLRDGKVVTTAAAQALPRERLVAAMVGREPERSQACGSGARANAALVAKGLVWRRPGSGRIAAEPISFAVAQGEILGLAGLQGSGSSELLHALFGSHGGLAAGRVQLDGRAHRVSGPRHSIASGVVLLSNDRRHSVLGEISVVANASLSSLKRFSRLGVVRRVPEYRAVERVVRRLQLSAPSLQAEARRLSGGNQQKVALARCLLARPRVLLLDEPTRGVDISAKADIHALIRELAAQGVAIMLIASELDELLALADRVLVLVRGRLAATVQRSDFSRERILQLAMGRQVEAA